MFRTFFSQVLTRLWPPRLLGGLGRILTEWQGSDIRERGILLLVFAPMLFCVLGLLFSVASFVLFVLPSFILRLLGWAVLTALFGAAGSYCHDRLKGRASSSSYRADRDFYDVTEGTSGPNTKGRASSSRSASRSTSKEEAPPSWFDNVRRMRWRE